MIFHFCNDSFGAPFAAESAAFAREHRIPLTLVRSARKPAPLGIRARRFAQTLARPQNPYVAQLYVEDINAPRFRARIKHGDHGIITGFDQIAGSELIASFETLVNLHSSLLPFYRGPVPTVWCLRNGETATGFTLHEVTERVDDGPVLHQATIAIDGITESEVLARAIAQSALPTFRLYLEKLVRREPWPRTSVDATQIYRNPVGYRSFPKSGSRL